MFYTHITNQNMYIYKYVRSFIIIIIIIIIIIRQRVSVTPVAETRWRRIIRAWHIYKCAFVGLLYKNETF